MKTRRDGSISLPHTYYVRQQIKYYHIHSRGKACKGVRSGLSRLLSNHIDFSKKENWTWLNLHEGKRCKCARDVIGRKRIRDANEKR